MIKLTGLLLGLMISGAAWAEYPIDKATQSCVSRAETHADQLNCLVEGEKAWDKSLNYYYRLLYKRLPIEGKVKLKQSELAWIKYRDAEFSFIRGLPYPGDPREMGNMWADISLGNRIEIVKKRTLELKSYYGLLAD